MQPRRHQTLIQRPCSHGVKAALFGLDIASTKVVLSAFDLVKNAWRKIGPLTIGICATQCMRPRASPLTAFAARLPLFSSKGDISLVEKLGLMRVYPVFVIRLLSLCLRRIETAP